MSLKNNKQILPDKLLIFLLIFPTLMIIINFLPGYIYFMAQGSFSSSQTRPKEKLHILANVHILNSKALIMTIIFALFVSLYAKRFTDIESRFKKAKLLIKTNLFVVIISIFLLTLKSMIEHARMF